MRNQELSVEGAQGHESLLQSCLEPYSAFKTNIRRTEPEFDLSDPEESSIPHDESGYASDNEPARGKPQSTIGLQELRRIIDSHITKELPGNVPFSAKMSCMLGCFKEWPALADACFESIFLETEYRCLQIATKHFDRFTYSQLNTIVSDTVNKALHSAKSEVEERLRCVMKLETIPYTQNDPYLLSSKDKYLAEYKAVRPVKDLDKDHLEQAFSSLRAARSSIRSIEDFMKHEVDPYEREIGVAADVRAYFQVSYKRIIDLVPRVINMDFLSSLHIRLKTALEQELQIGTEEGIKLAAKLLEEEPDAVNRREELEAKQKRLREIRSKLVGTHA